MKYRHRSRLIESKESFLILTVSFGIVECGYATHGGTAYA